MDTLWREYSGDLERDFAEIVRWRADALFHLPQARMFGQRAQIAALEAEHRLPSAHTASEFAEAGGLMAYGANLSVLFRGAATYVDKILKGAKPGDLPIEQPTSFELTFNLKTAKALGIAVPHSLLARADEVIQ